MAIKVPPIPAASVPLINDDGTMNIAWYRYFTALSAALKTIP